MHPPMLIRFPENCPCPPFISVPIIHTPPLLPLVQKEKEASGVPDVPSSVSGKLIDVDFAAIEDKVTGV